MYAVLRKSKFELWFRPEWSKNQNPKGCFSSSKFLAAGGRLDGGDCCLPLGQQKKKGKKDILDRILRGWGQENAVMIDFEF